MLPLHHSPEHWRARHRSRYLTRAVSRHNTRAPAGERYWQVVVLLLPVPGGVHSVSRETCQPESEISNR